MNLRKYSLKKETFIKFILLIIKTLFLISFILYMYIYSYYINSSEEGLYTVSSVSDKYCGHRQSYSNQSEEKASEESTNDSEEKKSEENNKDN